MLVRALIWLWLGPKWMRRDSLLGEDDDCDEADFVGANPDLYLGPLPDVES